MKFVYFGYDFMLPPIQAVIERGHELCGVFSFPCDGVFNFNNKTKAMAERLAIPFTEAKPTQQNIDDLINQGVELFLSAGYLFKIPEIDFDKAYGINFHPSLLPLGRGIMPSPHILLHAPEASGVSVHKLTQDYDAGDILWQTKLPLNNDEDIDTLSARALMAGLQKIPEIIDDLETYWDNATPQNHRKATSYRLPSQEARTIKWSDPVADIEKTARAFGKYECFAHVLGMTLAVSQISSWEEKHDHKPGTFMMGMDPEICIAAQDGFVLLKRFQKLEDPI